MCRDCRAREARTAQRRIRVLALQRDDAIDQGWSPGPMLLAEIACQRAKLNDARQALLPFEITSDGRVTRPIAL